MLCVRYRQYAFIKKSVSEHREIHDVGKTLIMLIQMFIHLATGRGFFMPNCRMYGGFMVTIGNLWLYIAFFGIVIVMLLIDFLGFKQKQGQDVSIKQAVTGV